MNHWHQCAICMEYFACICDDSIKLSAICEDCGRTRNQQIFADRALLDVLRALAHTN